ncbi:uncharacterized protein LOC124941441 [Impatiens glandulifera]|uniref:uncharacterized protein LOC124941441 n=1 Tax=Impatiens glandulifera TaxID=253017 RepID=UPI001FB0DB80|nr:uncharacterized protein LOC124941441 [Impatiens glandulifera]
MAKPDEREEEEEIQLTWGTWEELLLASAVHRHGINCWDSVAYEIRKRITVPGHLLTPINCERRYLDLRRRYTPGDDEDRADTEIPWLEELRKLRVAELRKEVERYDISIASLQLKVKKLKEEHEQSLKEVNEDERKSDLEKNKEMRGDGDGIDRSPNENPSVDKIDRCNQSVNGSNSTDQRIIKRESSKGVDKIEDNSCNGSSDSVEKEPVIESTKIETELLESVAESKDGDGAEGADGGRVEDSTDNSSNDEQSLAGDEPEKDDQSPVITGVSIKSKRLIDFLEIIRSNKLFSMFERRLKSQETLHYRSLIKQHMDLETIRSRLNEGWYADTSNKFFRDLLLIIGNAFVFFGKKSTEYPASIELLSLVLKEMSKGLSSEELEQKDAVLIQKPKSPTPIIVCRKRSSISAKPSTSSKDTTSLKGKPSINQKQAKPSSKIEEEQTKKKIKDTKFSQIEEEQTKKKVKDNKSSQQRTGKGSSSLVKQPNPTLAKGNNTNTNLKKQNPTISVNRSKRNSSIDDGLSLDRLKNLSSISDNSKSGGGDQKRNGKGNGSKGQASKISTNWGQVKEKECLTKQQKPLAAPANLSNLSGKRGREGGDNQAAASKQPKKRPRK